MPAPWHQLRSNSRRRRRASAFDPSVPTRYDTLTKEVASSAGPVIRRPE
jgi:hypothetical protein